MMLFTIVRTPSFFFKQKTAYEVRISDWSSDVCSSDLRSESSRGVEPGKRCPEPFGVGPVAALLKEAQLHREADQRKGRQGRTPQIGRLRRPSHQRLGVRSEEHTSELQSLMRISYAVFRLKKKSDRSRIGDG